MKHRTVLFIIDLNAYLINDSNDNLTKNVWHYRMFSKSVIHCKGDQKVLNTHQICSIT